MLEESLKKSAPPSLAELQTQLSKLFTAPQGPRQLAGDNAAVHQSLAWIQSNAQASALDRVSVYADAYFLRLQEILTEDYCLLKKLAGEELFLEIIVGYLQQHPPANPNAALVGARLPQFLDQSLWQSRQDLKISAALEWAIVESLHENWVHESAARDFARVQAALSQAYFSLDPSARFVEADFQVETLWLRRAESELPLMLPTVKPFLVVSRGPQGASRFYRMTKEEKQLFEHMQRGKNLADICEDLPDSPANREALSQMGQWIAHGLIKSIRTELHQG